MLHPSRISCHVFERLFGMQLYILHQDILGKRGTNSKRHDSHGERCRGLGVATYYGCDGFFNATEQRRPNLILNFCFESLKSLIWLKKVLC